MKGELGVSGLLCSCPESKSTSMTEEEKDLCEKIEDVTSIHVFPLVFLNMQKMICDDAFLEKCEMNSKDCETKETDRSGNRNPHENEGSKLSLQPRYKMITHIDGIDTHDPVIGTTDLRKIMHILRPIEKNSQGVVIMYVHNDLVDNPIHNHTFQNPAISLENKNICRDVISCKKQNSVIKVGLQNVKCLEESIGTIERELKEHEKKSVTGHTIDVEINQSAKIAPPEKLGDLGSKNVSFESKYKQNDEQVDEQYDQASLPQCLENSGAVEKERSNEFTRSNHKQNDEAEKVFFIIISNSNHTETTKAHVSYSTRSAVAAPRSGRRTSDPFAITTEPVLSAGNVALDVESKALVGDPSEKKPTIVDSEKSKKDSKKNRGSAVRQVIAAFIANLGTINTGLAFGFAAVANPQLRDPSSSIPVSEEQASWIASLSSVTTPVGCIISGYLMDKIGRKLTLIITEIPAILGLLIIAVSTDINMIYAGRLLVGLGSGMVGAPARVYTCEVTQPHLRGMLSALASVGVSLGVLIEYFLGSVMSWYLMAGISAIIPILAFSLILFMPETPNWLLQRGRTEAARASLHKLRGGKCDVDKELDDMMCFAAKNNVVRLSGMKETFTALMKPSTLKPFTILFLYFLIYQFSGVNTITFYAVDVFMMSGTKMNKNLATVILGVVRLISTIVACVLLRRCGRRPLTMISAIGCGSTMVGLGSYMYLRDGWISQNVEPSATWFPVACIFIFTIASTIGFLVVPWVMIGEVYPTQVRGIAGGMTTCSAHIFIFLVVKTFPEFKSWLGVPGTFWLYGGISLFGSIFFHFCLPETKGRTLQEIEDYFYGRIKKLGTKNPSTGNVPKVLDVPKGQILP